MWMNSVEQKSRQIKGTELNPTCILLEEFKTQNGPAPTANQRNADATMTEPTLVNRLLTFAYDPDNGINFEVWYIRHGSGDWPHVL